MSNNWEHFCEAVVVLAGPGSVKQRLSDAYTQHLSLVESAELPREVRASLFSSRALQDPPGPWPALRLRGVARDEDETARRRGRRAARPD